MNRILLMVATVLSCGGIRAAPAQEAASTGELSSISRFGDWELYCSDDEVDRRRRCHIEQGDFLVVGLRGADGPSVVFIEPIGAAPDPHGSITVAIDASPPLSWPVSAEPEQSGQEAIEQMLEGQEIVIRYLSLRRNPDKPLPERFVWEARASLAGFADAHAEMARRLDSFGGS
jgi:hypothetical protein